MTMRGRQLVAVKVFPINGSSYYDKVEISLGFSGGTTSGPTASDRLGERMFRAAVANFDEFMSWPVPARPAAKAVAVDSPFDGAMEWYKIRINQTGLCRITGAQLVQAGLSLDGLRSDSLRLLNGGGELLPVDAWKDRPVFAEVAVLVEDGGDGFFGAADYLLFFAEAVDRWIHRPGATSYWMNNQYDDANVYWLAVSGGPGLRMATADVTPGGTVDTTITTTRRRVHVEQDNLLREYYNGKIEDYYIWYWTNETSLEFFAPTPGRVSGAPALVNLLGRTFDPQPLNQSVGYMNLTVNGVEAAAQVRNQFQCTFEVSNLWDALNEFEVELWGGGDIAPYFGYAEIEYDAYLAPEADLLDLRLGDFDARARLDVVDGFSSAVTLLDLADARQPILLTGADRSGGSLQLDIDLTAARVNRLFFGTAAAAFAPVSIESVAPVDLYAIPGQVDLIIVTTAGLAPALDEYVTYRRSTGYTIRTVRVEDIMENFSFGLYDPTAIRDYLMYAYNNYPSPAPYAVLFVGDGTYDYLDHLGTGFVNQVPPYLRDLDESASDDNYVYFGRYGVLDSDTSYINGPDVGFDMLSCRWPVQTASQINTIVAKLKQYESAGNLGSWRTNVSLVADDERGTYSNETFHVSQTEVLEREHMPPALSRDKIYLWDYPLVNRDKPAVNDAIVHSLNEGRLLINYVGHGNPDVWAHEHVFTRDGDLPRLKNLDRLSLVYAASCAIGFFDDPEREGMAEDLLVHPSGGAIAVISASRLVYSSDNAMFNRKVFDILLGGDSLSIAEALFLAKVERQYGSGTVPSPVTNDRAYQMFGDPFVQVAIPRLKVVFDNLPDSLVALDRTRVTGTVYDRAGDRYLGDGILAISVFDSDREKSYRLINDSGEVITTIDYNLTGPTIFRGTGTITSGSFDMEFVTPLDVGYGGSGAKILAYAEFADIDGMGAVDSLTISSVIAVGTDSIGPDLYYDFPEAQGFTDGGVVTPGSRLVLTVEDSSGINLAGGLGHGITLMIDDLSEKIVDLTALFAYDQDDFTRGRAEYVLPDLAPGPHTFKIKAWDNANNSSTVEFSAEVQASTDLAIVELLNYPNPMQESTRFSYRLTRPVARLSLDIFTLSGRKIRTFDRFPTGSGYFDDIVWYGDDFSGDRVATGVYIFKATAVAAEGGTVDSFGKVVVIN